MKAIYALMAASVLMIVIGVGLILSQPEPEPEPELEVETGSEESGREIGLIPVPAEQDSDIPQLEIDAEPGSDAWCEQMMNLPNDQWTREQSQTFADDCIYE